MAWCREFLPIMASDFDERRENWGCLKIWLIKGYFQKLGGMVAVPTQKLGHLQEGGSEGWCNANIPLIFGICGWNRAGFLSYVYLS